MTGYAALHPFQLVFGPWNFIRMSLLHKTNSFRHRFHLTKHSARMRSTLVRFFTALFFFIQNFQLASTSGTFCLQPKSSFVFHKNTSIVLFTNYILSVPMKVLGAQFSLQVFRINMKNSQTNFIRPFQIQSLFLFGGKVGNILRVRTTVASSQGKCAARTEGTFTWTFS